LGPAKAGPFQFLLLLLALGVRLVAVLMGGLRVLLRGRGMLLALGMVALTVVFRSGPVCLRCVFVVLRCLVMFVFCHGRFLCCSQPATKAAEYEWFLPNACKSAGKLPRSKRT
jgi:hypothetical protein